MFFRVGCVPLLIACLLLPIGCGGGGGGPATVAPSADIRIENAQAVLRIDPQGRLTEVRIKSPGVDLAPVDPQPVLELESAAGTFPVETVKLEQGVLVATFDDGDASARIAVESRSGHFL